MKQVISSIGFIGTGVMGKSMVHHLLQGGYTVYVYNRTKEKATSLLKEGAHWCDSPKELVENVDVVMTMVGYPHDVEEIYFGTEGILEHANEGTIAIDFTTSTPTLAKRIYEAGKKKSVHTLDAPVSGGDIGAKEGRLAIMIGGEQEVYEVCLPLFEKLGENVQLQGPAGSGQHTKMCNQIAIASNMIGVCEAVAYAKKAGLDPEKVLQSISTGAAGSWSLSNLAPRMLKEDFAPGFYVKHFMKDIKIALDEAEKLKLPVPGLALAKELYDELIEEGEEDSGTQVLYKKYIRG
ncbi:MULTISPECIES: NAD(P)-dependent oxidoreductase [Bacillus]|uniref:Oxidoreductase n=1 Tax=Bacillus pseudomycoides TaxID=64104 RepID=A0A1Y3MU16_9BACI|nr:MULTISPECIES: NAD(P)-dependent oxidoreductase [Bacillus]EOQ03271.1 3-hydroxyisobutyrate dehydrogenase [Bacillus cereus VDM021]OOG94757.1 2-hydroxy-3-oxopropionate reductase [Bacillus mycoides]AIK39423.1 3-hydroxyacyl-CoA dehydrogenase, NAD binding domain protein [Bacillus pseudomycoides]AJI16120.1 NAD-binding of NADP-dependent 3-hydroxyisobutyrate dehydrogenase family protein [Bacillus pseudomycoides]EEM04349.1 3-hydroxyisobutyrate dehydrogenase [Bacillus pseudomycoides]